MSEKVNNIQGTDTVVVDGVEVHPNAHHQEWAIEHESSYSRNPLAVAGMVATFFGVFGLALATNKRPMSNAVTESRVWAQAMVVGPFSCYAIWKMLSTPDNRDKAKEEH